MFSMKLLGLVSKAISKAIRLPSVSQYGKDCGQYIPALTSHSVNKSIILQKGSPTYTLKILYVLEDPESAFQDYQVRCMKSHSYHIILHKTSSLLVKHLI